MIKSNNSYHRVTGIPSLLRTLIAAIAITVMLVDTSHGLTPTPAPAQAQPIALVGATVHIGNGQVIEQAVVTFAEGKITGVFDNSDEADIDGHQIIDVLDQHIYPGFILPDSDLGLREVDAVRHTLDVRERGQLNPSVRSIIAYNTDSELIPTLRFNGILTAQVSPKGGLVAGTSSIVQLDAWNWEDAMVVADDGVHIDWPTRTKMEFDFDTFSLKRVDNKDHPEQLGQIQKLLADASAYQQRNLGDGNNLKLASLSGLFTGEQTLFLSSNQPEDIIEAISFARRLRVEKIVLESGNAALEVADFLFEQDVSVLVNGVHRLPNQRHHDIDAPFRLPAKLIEKGLKVGLAYPGLMSSRNLGFIAGTTAAYGLEREQALRLITLNTAQILGIGDRLGSIETGKDATLFVSSGDALDMRGQQLSLAFIGGRQIELNATQQQLHQRFRKKYAAD